MFSNTSNVPEMSSLESKKTPEVAKVETLFDKFGGEEKLRAFLTKLHTNLREENIVCPYFATIWASEDNNMLH